MKNIKNELTLLMESVPRRTETVTKTGRAKLLDAHTTSFFTSKPSITLCIIRKFVTFDVEFNKAFL